MTIATREEAAQRAEAARTNVPDTCQLWTRTQYGAPSAGDQDHDGDADAVDGWESEPAATRHPGDRNPPRGVPVAWSGGSHGHGHRAISLGGGKIRSTDAGGTGRVATVDLDWPERTWGLHYLGWSDTIDGQVIPDGTPPKPLPHTKYVADYSFARPDPHALVAAGFRGVMRYVSPGSKKDLTVAEAQALHAAGLWIALVFESTAGRAGQGSAAGSFDAATADAAADKLGYPADAVIFYAVDFDASPAAVSAYFTGVKEASSRPVGIYGGVKVIDAKLASHGWQTEAWSSGKVSKHAAMLQHTKPTLKIPADTDENMLLKRRGFRVWHPATPPPPPPPPPPVHHRRRHGGRVGTINIKGFPRMVIQYVDEDLARAVSLIDVAGLQEIDPEFPDYTAAVRDLPSFDAAHLDCEDPIIWRASEWKSNGGRKTMTHPGKHQVSPNRYVTEEDLESLHNGAELAVFNTHAVSKVFYSRTHGVKPTSWLWRRKMWTQHMQIMSELVTKAVNEGKTALIFGDFNHHGIPKFHADQVTIINDSLDGIAYVPAVDGANITVRKEERVSGGWHTDHDLLRAWLKVTP